VHGGGSVVRSTTLQNLAFGVVVVRHVQSDANQCEN
jgi:hypothetical protein